MVASSTRRIMPDVAAASWPPERVHERAVAGDVPDRDPGPFPAVRLGPPFEPPAAEPARLREFDHLAMDRLSIAPDDLRELEREGPVRANRRDDLGGGRCAQVHVR